MKAVVVFISVFIFLFYSYFIKSVFASDLLISEFLPNPSSGSEWVEFYNSSNATVDLSDYYFDDDTNFDSDVGSSAKIALSGLLPTLQICYWELSSYLNNNGDSPTLFKVQSGTATSADTYTYASSSAGLSYARVPDGGNWAILQSLTQASNKCIDLSPTSTPTPTPTPTTAPTNTPTPTLTPTASPTNAPTPTRTPTPTPASNAPTSKPTTPSTSENVPQNSVLGESAGTKKGLDIAAPDNLISDTTKKPDTIFQGFLIVLGIVLIAISIMFTLRIIKKGEQIQNEEE